VRQNGPQCDLLEHRSARRHKLGREVKLDRREIAAIQILDINYSSHRLRYIVTGATKTPQLIYMERAAKSLVLGFEFLCTGIKKT